MTDKTAAVRAALRAIEPDARVSELTDDEIASIANAALARPAGERSKLADELGEFVFDDRDWNDDPVKKLNDLLRRAVAALRSPEVASPAPTSEREGVVDAAVDPKHILETMIATEEARGDDANGDWVAAWEMAIEALSAPGRDAAEQERG